MQTNSIDIIFKRRSIRKFQDKPVEKEKIRLLLEAAMAAPSATNAQPWEFIVVDDPEMLKQLRSNMPLGKYPAPLAIIPCGNPGISGMKRGTAARFWVQDCSAATQNILLAAVGLGLGSVWCGVHPIGLLEGRIRSVFNIPKSVTPLGVILLGYPDEEKEAGTKYREDRVHWQVYEPKVKGKICK